MPDDQGSPGKRAVKRVSACMQCMETKSRGKLTCRIAAVRLLAGSAGAERLQIERVQVAGSQ